MKTNTTFDRIQASTLPTGRRAFVALRTQDTAAELRAQGGLTPEEDAALTGLASVCQSILSHCASCTALERGYNTSKLNLPTTDADAPAVDQQADRIVSGLYDTPKTFIKRFLPQEPEHKAAAAFKRSAFPKGVKYITQATYPEQLERMKDLFTYCRSPEGVGQARALSLSLWIDKLADILPIYEAVMKKIPPAAVRYGQLKAAWKDGHVLLCQLIHRVFSAFPDHTPEHEARRALLLSHLTAQEQAVADMRRRNASVQDIDPTTGAEVDTPAISD
jgi:hypothetical protein